MCIKCDDQLYVGKYFLIMPKNAKVDIKSVLK